jgi:hypothetical protein
MDPDPDPALHRDPATDVVPPHRVSARNTGARTVLVMFGVMAVIAGLWLLANLLL